MATAKTAPKKTAPTSAAPAAKTAPAKTAPAKKAAAAPAPEPEVEAAAPRTRGPRGVPETAVISLLVEGNPKREGSKAHAVFSHYEDGQSIAEFCAALEATDADMVKEATPNLVYDAKHGFISIEGYEPPGGVIEKTVKEPKPVKATAPAKKGGKSKATQAAEQAAADETAEEEVVD